MRLAVILFNLGGPDGPDAVEPFLRNLFGDPAIIGAPWPIRPLLARLIARRRAGAAAEIYAKLGGSSPLLANTRAQAQALEHALSDLGEVRVFPAMRYWRPQALAVAAEVERFAPERVVLLPLYPQFSSTTTASSIKAWEGAAAPLRLPTHVVCCYPAQAGFVHALAALITPAYEAAARHGSPRILFSAHGLPKRVVERGDPYQWQVEATAQAVVDELAIPGLDWRVCFQSRVGPLAWIGPATDDEIKRAGVEKRPLVVAPLAFVSEHSETLVELDIEYRELAGHAGVPYYARVPTVGTHPEFIAGLRDLVTDAVLRHPGLCPPDGRRLCPAAHGQCPVRK